MLRFTVGDLATLTNTFKVSGSAADPTTVALTVTDPTGTATTYTYAAAQVIRTGTGVYTKDVTAATAGTWTYKWVGTGAAADVQDGSFYVAAVEAANLYCTIEQLKSALGLTDTAYDVELDGACQAAARAIDESCGRRFYRTTETRYYSARGRAWDWYRLDVDDLVSVTTLKTDSTGAGVYDATWAVTDYALLPRNAATDGRPYTSIETMALGSYTFPITYPYAVEVAGVFGWPAVPPQVRLAAQLQAARWFKRARDAPFGVAGLQFEGGGIRLMAKLDPDVEVLLAPYRNVTVA